MKQVTSSVSIWSANGLFFHALKLSSFKSGRPRVSKKQYRVLEIGASRDKAYGYSPLVLGILWCRGRRNGKRRNECMNILNAVVSIQAYQRLESYIFDRHKIH
jgi:hypothetical protein